MGRIKSKPETKVVNHPPGPNSDEDYQERFEKLAIALRVFVGNECHSGDERHY
jgi:hypothetical protein